MRLQSISLGRTCGTPAENVDRQNRNSTFLDAAMMVETSRLVVISMLPALASYIVQSSTAPTLGAEPTTVPPVTVVGRRPDKPVQVIGPDIDRYIVSLKARYTGNRSYKNGHPFSLWPATVCFKVDGLQDQARERFEAGLSKRVETFGLKVSDACEGRVYVAITRHADSIISQIQSKPSLVGYASRFGDIADLSAVRSPIHWVETTVDHELRSMIMIVDADGITGVSDDTLLDYISFVIMVAPNNDTRVSGVRSIANAFGSGDTASDHWTRLDRAFLEGMYNPRTFNPLTDAEVRRRTLDAYEADVPH